MKFHAEIKNQKHDIELKREGEKVFAEIDGRSYELEASEPEPNIYLLKNENKVYEIFVSPQKNIADPMQVRIGTDELEIKLNDPKRLRSVGIESEHAEGLAEIKTAMPGKVVRILIKEGAEVKKGDAVVVVEAMKMQNEMKSPKDGIVKKIRFEEGATVSGGDILVIVQ